MTKPNNEQPDAAEKGQMIAMLARRGITGVDLAAIANKSRAEIADMVKARILEMKGA